MREKLGDEYVLLVDYWCPDRRLLKHPDVECESACTPCSLERRKGLIFGSSRLQSFGKRVFILIEML
jgi:hypothetical protein